MINKLPDIGTLDDALNKMKEAHKSFLDCITKFSLIADFYVDENNTNKRLPNNVLDNYTNTYQKFKSATIDDIGYQLASYTLFYLDFVDEVKENLTAYNDLLTNGPDKSASTYDQTCDYLAIRDEFIDLIDEINGISKAMIADKEAYTNYNDPEYDLNAKEVDKNKFNA